jgi:hypothetical protein
MAQMTTPISNVAMLLALYSLSTSSAQAADTLMLACKGTSIDLTKGDAKPEATFMGIVVNFTTRTIDLSSWPSSPIEIREMNDVQITFGDLSRAGDRGILGTIDRVTGRVLVIDVEVDARTTRARSTTGYSLECSQPH